MPQPGVRPVNGVRPIAALGMVIRDLDTRNLGPSISQHGTARCTEPALWFYGGLGSETSAADGVAAGFRTRARTRRCAARPAAPRHRFAWHCLWAQTRACAPVVVGKSSAPLENLPRWERRLRVPRARACADRLVGRSARSESGTPTHTVMPDFQRACANSAQLPYARSLRSTGNRSLPAVRAPRSRSEITNLSLLGADAVPVRTKSPKSSRRRSPRSFFSSSRPGQIIASQGPPVATHSSISRRKSRPGSMPRPYRWTRNLRRIRRQDRRTDRQLLRPHHSGDRL
jgi:hypothetical protein